MNQHMSTSAYGTLIEPATFQIQRVLPGSVDKVWSYLADSALRAKWLAAGVMEPVAGSGFELVWRNDDLSDPPGARPEGAPEEHRMKGTILSIDAPRMLEISWGEAGGSVLFELQAAGAGTLLTLTHRRLMERASVLNVSAGWHTHLDIMVMVLAGAKPTSFWARWAELKGAYERCLGV